MTQGLDSGPLTLNQAQKKFKKLLAKLGIRIDWSKIGRRVPFFRNFFDVSADETADPRSSSYLRFKAKEAFDPEKISAMVRSLLPPSYFLAPKGA